MAGARRRLLYVTPFSLLPAVEGHRKRMAMTFEAARRAGFEVHILFIPREYGWCELFDPKIYREMMTVAELTFFCHAETPKPPLGDVYTLDEWWPPQADEFCRWLFANYGYEMVFCNYVFMSRVFQFVDRATVKVIDSHDLFADRKQLLLDNDLKPEFYYTDRQSELEGLERADVVLAIKEQEAEYFRRNSATQVITLPYCQHDQIAEPPPRARPAGEKLRFGFFGSPNSINVKNIVEFSAFLERRRPGDGYEFELWLYGSLCKRLPTNLPEFVKIGGLIDSVEEFYARIDAVINPQYFSTGLKIKVAEALAFKSPLICHRHAFEGFGEPLHPAQDCADFEALLAAMTAAAADPAALDDIGRASAAVQARLVDECQRQLNAIFSAATVAKAWLYVFADAGAFNRSRAYRHLVESFFLAFAQRYFIAVVASDAPSRAGADPEAADGDWAAFQRKANRSAVGILVEDIEPGARCAFFDDPAAAGFGRARPGGIVFIDAVRLARRLCGQAWRDWLADVAASRALVRCVGPRRTDRERTERSVAIRYFRWLPWEMNMWMGADNHDLLSEIWLLTDEHVESAWERIIAEAFPDFGVRVFRENCGTAAAADCGVLRSADQVFALRQAPRLVLRLTGNGGFNLVVEWCLANGVPCRDVSAYVNVRDRAAARDSLAQARLSDLFRPPEPPGQSHGSVSARAASGWDALETLLEEGGMLAPANT